MKRIKIIETDIKYISNFRDFLIQLGAKPVSDIIFEVADTFDETAYHGLALDNTDAYAKELGWLKAYNGNFEFYLSLKSQYERKGTLSPKQFEALTRAVERDAKPVAKASTARGYSIETGTIIIVSRWLANKLASMADCANPHFAFEVIEVKAETERAYQLTLKLTAQRTSHCCVCGIRLTNPESVEAGIGPICGGRWGIKLDRNALQVLAEKLETTRLVTSWLPKTSIKERFKA